MSGRATAPRKVFLDDERQPPEGWTLVRWPREAIALLKRGVVAEISLDHDLGDDSRGRGYDVLLWMENAVEDARLEPPAVIRVHSANVSARIKMEAAVASIRRRREALEDPEPAVRELLEKVKAALSGLSRLLRDVSEEPYEDRVYRFYHQSWKVYRIQEATLQVVSALQAVQPDRALDEWFMEIVRRGPGSCFKGSTTPAGRQTHARCWKPSSTRGTFSRWPVARGDSWHSHRGPFPAAGPHCCTSMDFADARVPAGHPGRGRRLPAWPVLAPTPPAVAAPRPPRRDPGGAPSSRASR
jgi:hypothetical protein